MIGVALLLGLAAVALIAGQVSLDRDVLPIIEVPVDDRPGDLMAVLVSGDGGWAAIDRTLAEALKEQGVPTVGLDALRYFWFRRSAGEVAGALGEILDTYLPRWNRKRVVLIGFSRGANTVPFMVDGLRPPERERIAFIALLAPSVHTDFYFRLGDWFGANVYPDSLLVAPAVEKLQPIPTICIWGTSDTSALCPKLSPHDAQLIPLPGGHHFDDDFATVAALIVEHMNEATTDLRSSDQSLMLSR